MSRARAQTRRENGPLRRVVGERGSKRARRRRPNEGAKEEGENTCAKRGARPLARSCVVYPRTDLGSASSWAGRGQDCPLRRFARPWRGAPAAPKDDERERARNAARTLRIAFERGERAPRRCPQSTPGRNAKAALAGIALSLSCRFMHGIYSRFLWASRCS